MLRRNDRSTQAVEQAVDYGTKNYGDRFFLPVKPTRRAGSATSARTASPAGTTVTPATEEVPRA
ncbi:MAG: hypothetical protein ACRDRK_01710 [Pseudonocardia sp.]